MVTIPERGLNNVDDAFSLPPGWLTDWLAGLAGPKAEQRKTEPGGSGLVDARTVRFSPSPFEIHRLS